METGVAGTSSVDGCVVLSSNTEGAGVCASVTVTPSSFCTSSITWYSSSYITNMGYINYITTTCDTCLLPYLKLFIPLQFRRHRFDAGLFLGFASRWSWL